MSQLETEIRGSQRQDALRCLPVMDRAAQISRYLAITDIQLAPKPELPIAEPDSTGTVIIPAYNEASQIWRALESVGASGSNLDVVVIDNNSTDGTGELVREYARKSCLPVSLIACPVQGYGPTRRTGFNQTVANYIYRYPQADKRHYLIMLDADSRLTPDYINNHRLLAEGGFAAIGVTYRFPPDIDTLIEQITGLPNYLYSIARLSSRVTKAGMATIQTAAQGGAIEIGAFTAIDPEQFRVHETTGSDRFLGREVKKMGLPVGFNPAVTIHCERRFTAELVWGMQMNQSYGTHPGEIRRRQHTMTPEEILTAMRSTGRDDYVRFHRQRLESFVRRNIVEPIRTGETSGEPLRCYLKAEGCPVDVACDSAVAQLADIFTHRDDMLSLIYQ